jgi:uncharacterized protein (TIGR00730 family)
MGRLRYCVFCGSSRGTRPEYAEAARALGHELGRRGIDLVYGGGNIGLMGVVADSAIEAGARVIGVIPRALVDREVAHDGLHELRVVESMHERKAMMAELADGFIALPGGFGTFEELFEVLTWAQLGVHRKPCALVDVCGYFDELKSTLDRAVNEGFLAAAHRGFLLAETSPERVIEAMASFRPPRVEGWLDRSST